MVEAKLYKTKLCVLYQQGHCRRQSCSFAHGNAELRRSFNGRQDNRGSDLRDRLDRRRSSPHRYSPGRDARGRHSSQGESPRGREKMRKRGKKEQLDGQSDFSGSLRFSEGTEDKVKDSRQASFESKSFLDEQLRKARSEYNILNDHKCELEIYLEERNLEANSLTSKIQELEMQLNQEKEESERITSKIKKFIKAYNHRMHLENELKRSHKQVQKLGEQLSLDFARPGATREDPRINNRSHEDSAGNHVSPKKELQKNASPRKKRPRVYSDVDEMSNPVNPTKDGGVMGKIRLEKLSRWSAHPNNNKKAESKVSDSGIVLPSMSMAAHAMDEVDIVETGEKLEGTETLIGAEKEVAFKIPPLPFPPPPPPPIPPNAYVQYKGDDENVNIDGMEEDTVEVDIV